MVAEGRISGGLPH